MLHSLHRTIALLPVAGSLFAGGAHFFLLLKSESHRLDPERMADYWIITAYFLTFWFYAFDLVQTITI